MSKKKSKAQSRKKKNITQIKEQEIQKTKKKTTAKTTTKPEIKKAPIKETPKEENKEIIKEVVKKEIEPKKETKVIKEQPKKEIKEENKAQEEKKIEETKIDTKEEQKQEEAPKKTLNKYQKAYQNKAKKQNKGTSKSKQVVDNKDVIYNVALKNEEEKKKAEQKEEPKVKYIGLKEYIYRSLKNFKNKKKTKEIDPKVLKAQEKERRRQEYIEKLVLNQNLEKEVQKIEKDYSSYNIVIRSLVKIYRNLHVLFNAVIIASFLILGLAAFKVEVFETSSIIYFGSLLLFLILVAMFQNKYLSGKIFTIILVIGMAFVTSKIQYTYDFIGIINSNQYEYKTYYVVAIDNSQNRTIHNINNKKVGVLKEVSTKTSRVLNTKIKKVTYLEFENNNELFDAFYGQNFRAMIVTENQYKYLKNNPRNNKEIKILHEFKAVTEK